jgi:hypothetical protein
LVRPFVLLLQLVIENPIFALKFDDHPLKTGWFILLLLLYFVGKIFHCSHFSSNCWTFRAYSFYMAENGRKNQAEIFSVKNVYSKLYDSYILLTDFVLNISRFNNYSQIIFKCCQIVVIHITPFNYRNGKNKAIDQCGHHKRHDKYHTNVTRRTFRGINNKIN